MGYVYRLVKNNKTLIDFGAAPYALAEGFVPPSTAQAPYYSGGVGLTGQRRIGVNTSNNGWSFTVHVYGNTSAMCEQAVDQLNAVLEQEAGDEANPLYIEWLPQDYVDFAPTWGQRNAPRRAAVEFGIAYKPTNYWRGTRYSFLANVPVALNVRPPEGQGLQALIRSGGCVSIRKSSSVSALNNGVTFQSAITNMITNPSFETNTTGWTFTNITGTRVDTFAMHGSWCARSVAATTASATIAVTFVQNTVYTVSLYARKADGSAVVAADFDEGLICEATNMAVALVKPEKDGWYRVIAAPRTAAASAASTAGYNQANNTTLYIDGVMCVATTGSSAYVDGAQIGCAWTGTAHASSSTSTAATATLSSSGLLEADRGTITMVVTPRNVTATSVILNWYAGANDYWRLFLGSDATWQYYDGSAHSTNGGTMTAGTTAVIHAVWDITVGLTLYVNGAAVGSVNTDRGFVDSAAATLYIGYEQGGSNYSNAIIHALELHTRAMTAAEALADYTNLAALITADLPIDSLPNAWTKDGDGVVDNCDDSTRDNWCLLMDIPGTLPPETKYTLDPSAAYGNIWMLLNSQADVFTAPTGTQYYYEGSGTTDIDVSGDGFETFSDTYDYVTITPTDKNPFYNEVHFMARGLLASAGTGYLNGAISYTSTVTAALAIPRTESVAINDTDYNLYYLGSIGWFNPHGSLQEIITAVEYTGDIDVQFDYALMAPGKLAKIEGKLTDGAVIVHGNAAYEVRTNYTRIAYIGEVLEPLPNTLNTLWILMGDNDETSVTTDTITITNIWVKPRYHIL